MSVETTIEKAVQGIRSDPRRLNRLCPMPNRRLYLPDSMLRIQKEMQRKPAKSKVHRITGFGMPTPPVEAYGPAPAWEDEQEPIKRALRAIGANVP